MSICIIKNTNWSEGKLQKNQIEPDEDGFPELRPKIDFHKFLR